MGKNKTTLVVDADRLSDFDEKLEKRCRRLHREFRAMIEEESE